MKPLIITLFILTLASTMIGCTETLPPKSGIDNNWADSIQLDKAVDINPQSKIVEINLEAIETEIELSPETKPGVLTRMWTYNGVFPGPTIHANIGDTLIVNFTNKLAVNTTVHWHGLELPAKMDGSMTAQFPVMPNETFRYTFTLNRAATYWYHPHIQSNIQIEKGLYGALIVHDPEEDIAFSLPSHETTIILDDILLDAQSQIEPAMEEQDNVDPVENAITQLNGRVGNAFLINGKLLPFDTDGSDLKTVKVRSGHPVRLRLINAANASFFRLSIPNHTMYKIGGDGGLLTTPVAANPIDIIIPSQKTSPVNSTTSNSSASSSSTSSSNTSIALRSKVRPRDGAPLEFYSDPDLSKGIMLVPGERADIVFTPDGEVGDRGSIEWHFFPRGLHGVNDDGTGKLVINHNHQAALTAPVRLLNFEFVEDTSPTHLAYSPPVALKPIEKITTTEATPILPILFGHSDPASNGDITFFASESKKPFADLDDTTALSATIGETYIWEITNLSQGDHPFHPHGFTFQHISTEYIDQNAVETSVMEFPSMVTTKDTIRIPGRRGLKGQSKTIVRLAVKFDDTHREGEITAVGKIPNLNDNGEVDPGGWFVHCHILEHATRGMGTYLNLRPAN